MTPPITHDALARLAVTEFMSTRNLDPTAPTGNEIVLMAWKLAGVTGLPIHKARMLITKALKSINESNPGCTAAISS